MPAVPQVGLNNPALPQNLAAWPSNPPAPMVGPVAAPIAAPIAAPLAGPVAGPLAAHAFNPPAVMGAQQNLPLAHWPLIQIGLFITWAKWMSYALTVELCIGNLRDCLALLR